MAASTSASAPSEAVVTSASAPATGPAASSPAVATPPPPPEKPQCKMAVLDLQPGEGFTEKSAVSLTDVVTTTIGQNSPCQVLSRNEIRAMLSFEAEKQLLGCGNDSCLAELGGALGVENLITGNVSKMGTSTLLSLKNVNLNKLVVERRVTDTFAGSDEEVPAFALWMARRLVLDAAIVGAKPVPKPKVIPADTKVHYVEKNMTTWRVLAWTGLGVTALLGALTGVAAATNLGLSMFLIAEKTSTKANLQTISAVEAAGPYFASGTNLGIYVTPVFALATVVLFFLPAETTEIKSIDSGDRSGTAALQGQP